MTAEEQEAYLDLAYQDVSDAFTYYMSEVNDGLPLILAGVLPGVPNAAAAAGGLF